MYRTIIFWLYVELKFMGNYTSVKNKGGGGRGGGKQRGGGVNQKMGHFGEPEKVQ